jgi:hypothetical protein
MERLIRRVLVCVWMLIPALAFAQQWSVTAGNHGRCDASWEMDSPPVRTLESPWGTVTLGKNGRALSKAWTGSTPSGIHVTIYPEGAYGKGTLVRFSFAVCQRVTTDIDGTETSYILSPKASFLRPGYWYLEPKASYTAEKKGNEVELAAQSTGHGLDVKLLPPPASPPPPTAPSSQPRKGHSVSAPQDKWKFEIVMTCKEGKCVTPAGIPVLDRLP